MCNGAVTVWQQCERKQAAQIQLIKSLLFRLVPLITVSGDLGPAINSSRSIFIGLKHLAHSVSPACFERNMTGMIVITSTRHEAAAQMWNHPPVTGWSLLQQCLKDLNIHWSTCVFRKQFNLTDCIREKQKSLLWRWKNKSPKMSLSAEFDTKGWELRNNKDINATVIKREIFMHVLMLEVKP